MTRTPSLLLAAAVAALAACSDAGTHATPRACNIDDDCGVGWCVQHACVADAPPTVHLDVPAQVRANKPTTFSAQVIDPDPGDAVSSAAWTLSAVTGGCDPDVDDRSSSALAAVFWCPGTYRIALAVLDARGAEGRAEATFEVIASPSAPTISAPADLTLPHRCAGNPVTCEVVPSGSIIQLGAAASDPDGGPLTYAWRALPPPAASEAVASFDPGPSAASPAVRVTSPGTAIAGAWRFRLRVTDTEGLVAQAYQTLTVENRPPTVTGSQLTVPHAYTGGRYVAEAALAPTWSDPDGDSVSLAFDYAEPLATGCTAAVTADAGAGKLVLSCADPAAIAPGVERAIRVVASDANAATAEGSFGVTVTNRPPELALAAGVGEPMYLPHVVAPCATGTCLVMSGTSPFVASDPDGDPLTPVHFDVVLPPSAPQVWSSVSLDANGLARFEIGTPVENLSGFVLGPYVTGRISDPWTETSRMLNVQPTNRSPIVKTVAPYTSVGHVYDPIAKAYVASAPSSTFEDPDGDPLAPAPASGACQAVATNPWRVDCKVPFDPASSGALPLASIVGQLSATVRAADPFGLWVDATQAIAVGNGPPTVACAAASVQLCTCKCTAWDVLGDCSRAVWAFVPGAVTLATVSDPDHDPIDVSAGTMTGRGVGSFAVQITANTVGTYTSNVSATDGLLAASGTCTVSVACSKASSACTP